jgi:predicted Zn-dependent peptidase
MRAHSYLFLGSALFFSAAVTTPTLHAEIDRKTRPEPAPAPAAAFPDYKEQKLANGLKVFVIEDERKPTVVFRLVVKSGSIYDDKKTGLSGFVATLLSRGTAARDAATFAQETDFIGMNLEAASGPDSLSVIAGGLTKYTDKIIELFSDAVLHPAFAKEQFAMEQRKTLSKLAAERMEPEALAGKLSGKIVFGGHPYGAYRTPETVQSITRDDLLAYHQKHFIPNNATLAIVGDVKAGTIVPLIEKAFAAWKPGDVPTPEMPKPPTMEGIAVHLVDRRGSVQSNVIICEPGPPRANGHLPELNVLNATLGGGFSGRLFQNLRETHGYTYGAYSAFVMNKHAGMFEATAETRNEVTTPAIRETFTEMQRMRDTPVPDAELELQRQYNVGNYLLSLENAGRTATRVQDIDLYGLPADFYKTYAKRMSEVTPAQIQELAKEYLDIEKLAVVVVGEAKEIKSDLEKIGKVFVYDTDLKPVPGGEGVK